MQRMQGWEVIHPHVGQQRHCACHKGLFGSQESVLHFSKTSRTEETLKDKGKKLSLILILVNSKESLKIPLFNLK